MKTQISKATIKTILTQARSLGAFEAKRIATEKAIQCEVEKPNGKRVFVLLPLRLIDWLKDFDSPPTVEITVGKQTVEQWVTPAYKVARLVRTVTPGFIVRATVSEGGRTSRLSCVVRRSKACFNASVFLRIDEDGNVTCVERVAKLARVECAHGKKFIRAGLLDESHGGKWLLAKHVGGVWSVLYQPAGMIGVAVALASLGGKGMTESEAQKEAGIKVTEEIKKRVILHQFDKSCELAEQAEREAREAMGEEVGVIVRAKRAEVDPALPAPSPVVESVSVVETLPAPIPPTMESAQTPSEGITALPCRLPGMVTVNFPANDTGWKTNEQWLFECFSGKWNRRHGYFMRADWFAAFLASIAQGCEADRRLAACQTMPMLTLPSGERLRASVFARRCLASAVADPVSAAVDPIPAPSPCPGPLAGELQTRKEPQGQVTLAPSVAVEPRKQPSPSPCPLTAELRPITKIEAAFACFVWLAWSTAPSTAPIPIRLPPPPPPPIKRAAQRERVRSYGATLATAHRPCPTMPSARANAPPAVTAPPCRCHFRPHPPAKGITERYQLVGSTHRKHSTPRLGELRKETQHPNTKEACLYGRHKLQFILNTNSYLPELPRTKAHSRVSKKTALPKVPKQRKHAYQQATA